MPAAETRRFFFLHSRRSVLHPSAGVPSWAVYDRDTPLVDTCTPVNLSVSPVQIVTMGTCYIHLPSFNTSYTLLHEKM